MKILVDMNLSPSWVEFLSDHGIQAVHWSDIGAPDAADAEILTYALSNGFAVFTHDLDFGTMLAARSADGPSVIQLRDQDVMPASVGATVVRAVETVRSQLEAGALVTIDSARQRIRMLPIRR